MTTRIRSSQINTKNNRGLEDRLKDLEHIGAPVLDTTDLPTTGMSNERRFVGSEKKEYVFDSVQSSWVPVGGSSSSGNSVSSSYTYNTDGQVTQEVLTGDINRTTDYYYHAVGTTNEGKIDKEVITENSITVTKTYNYDTNGNVTGTTLS